MADVLISYHPDSTGETVRRIAAALEANGISCWYAAKELYDKDCVGEIAREIRKCRVFLLALNQDALKSRYMESEAALAYRRVMNRERLTFLCFLTDNCDWKDSPIASYLNRAQIMDGDFPVAELCDRIARIVRGKPIRRPSERTASRPSENL